MNVSIRKMDDIVGLFGGTFPALYVVIHPRRAVHNDPLHLLCSLTGCSWWLRSREHQAHRPVTYVGAFDAGAWHRHLPGVWYKTTRWRHKLHSWLFLVRPRVYVCVLYKLLDFFWSCGYWNDNTSDEAANSSKEGKSIGTIEQVREFLSCSSISLFPFSNKITAELRHW